MGMIGSVLVGSAILLCMLLLEKKRYQLTMKKLFAIHVIMTVFTTVGACFGSFIGGESILGLRLYGILIIDTIVMFVLPKKFQIDVGRFSDYMAAPIIAVCAIVKIPCLIVGCCSGKELFFDTAGNAVYFPSQIVEFSIWVLLTLWLVMIECRGNHKNLLWSIASIWFGLFRYLVDFMRKYPTELHVFGMPASRFWPLFVVAMGVLFMIYSFRKYWGRNPRVIEVIKAIFGIKLNKD